MIRPFGMGLGGKLGSGRQWMSWIHRDDLVELYLHAVTHEETAGPDDRRVAQTRSEAPSSRGRSPASSIVPRLFRLPRWGLRLALGKVSSVLFASQRCRPEKALQAGFEYRYPALEPALRDAVLLLRAKQAGVA
jgi:NAD dependent epimerase/dehydratase family enzyme